MRKYPTLWAAIATTIFAVILIYTPGCTPLQRAQIKNRAVDTACSLACSYARVGCLRLCDRADSSYQPVCRAACNAISTVNDEPCPDTCAADSEF